MQDSEELERILTKHTTFENVTLIQNKMHLKLQCRLFKGKKIAGILGTTFRGKLSPARLK